MHSETKSVAKLGDFDQSPQEFYRIKVAKISAVKDFENKDYAST